MEALEKLQEMLDMTSGFVHNPASDLDPTARTSIPNEDNIKIIEGWRGPVQEMMTAIKTDLAAATTAASADAHLSGSQGSGADGEVQRTATAVDFPASRYSWRAIGDLGDAQKSVCLEVRFIPRLRCVLAWVRGDLLLWDVDKDEVCGSGESGEGGRGLSSLLFTVACCPFLSLFVPSFLPCLFVSLSLPGSLLLFVSYPSITSFVISPIKECVTNSCQTHTSNPH